MLKLKALINAMTKSEKRYFKLNSGLQKGEKNYLDLMDAISKQKEYDESKLLKKFAGRPFTKNLGVAKSDLYKLLMNSLRQYYSQSSLSSKLADLLKDIEILYNKGLYPQCQSIITKGINLADQSDKFLFKPMFIQWQRVINQAHYYNLDEEAIDDSWKQVNISLQKADNYNDYWKVSSLSFLYYRKYSLSGDKKSLRQLKKMEGHNLLKEASMAASFLARQLYYNTYVFFSQVNDDLRASLYYAEKIVQLFEDNPLVMLDNLKSYITVYYNYISILIDAKDFEKAIRQIERMEEIPKSYPRQKRKTINMLIFRYQTYLELIIANKTCQFDRVLSRINVIEENLKKYSEGIGLFSIMKIYYQLSYMYFLKEDYYRSQACCYKILQNQGLDWTKESFHINLIYLLAHYELGNVDLQESIGRQIYRILKTGTDFSDFENILGQFVRRLPVVYKNKELVKLYQSTYAALDELPEESLNTITLSNFNILIWLKSKIENKKFSELLAAQER